MSSTANNFVTGDCHATDTVATRVIKKSTNLGGVHQEHVLVDGLTVGLSSKVAIGAASAQSGALAGAMVRLVSTQNCHVAFGANPTAVADGSCLYLPAANPIIVAITSGQKLAVIEDSAAGNLFITVMQ